MADIHKRLEKAEKYLQKGKPKDALSEYLAILDDDPNQDTVRQQAADICITLGHNHEACELLSVLFERQATINDHAKAVANYKKLARLGVPTVDQTFRYSQLIEKSDKKHALDGYQFAVRSFLKANRKDEALAVYKRIVLLDASAANHKNLGELADALNDHKTAGTSFLALAELEPERAATWLERGYRVDPTNAALALAYGRSLNALNKTEMAIRVLEPLAVKTTGAPEFREAYAQALMSANRAAEAEPYVWELFERFPSQYDEVGRLIGTLIRQEKTDKALAVSEKLEHMMNKQGKRREFIALLKDVTTKNAPTAEFLEYMVALYNSANREQDYCETLVGLFQLYFAAGNFLKAADCLDRAAEVDPYQTGNQKRLDLLRGKIDQHRYDAIANRFQIVGSSPEGGSGKQQEQQGFELEPTVLEDFMLQAEIFIQYGLRSKAVERLERISKLFAHEEDKNEKLRDLYVNAGFVPTYEAAALPAATGTTPAAASTQPPVSQFGQAPSYPKGAPAPPSSAAAPPLSEESAVDNFSRVTEITRNIYRQSTVKGVLFTTVNDVGRHYSASRCIAGLCTPGKPPSAALEYCATGVKQSEVQHIVRLLGAVQNLAVELEVVALDDATANPKLASVKDSIAALGIKSLLAVPLLDAANNESVGMLLLEQCDQPRVWRSTDAVVLRTIADQMVLAVNNAKLRSLMKNLAVTDEKSGLLKRSSYLDVLLSETRRAMAQNSTASVLLFDFGKASTMVKEIGEPGVDNLMQQIGQTICSQIRQNDIAVRYDLTTIALILPDTTDKNSFFVVDKMRKVLTGFKVAGSERPLSITVGIAEAVMHSQYDPIDIVTEVINRVEAALTAAKTEGPNSAKSLAPQFANTAVA
jgi:diguanylate cyclase (GGDEF)-like protein